MKRSLLIVGAFVLAGGLLVAAFAQQPAAPEPQGMMEGHGMMGHGMMGMMRTGPTTGMMGQAMASPEIMGTLMMMHGETVVAIGEIGKRYEGMPGRGETRERMHREMMARIGEILLKYGQLLKERGQKGGQ